MTSTLSTAIQHRVVGWDRHESNPAETGLAVVISFSADNGETEHDLAGAIGLDDDLEPVLERVDENDLDLDADTARRLLLMACNVVWNALILDGAAMAETRLTDTGRWLFNQMYRGEAARLLRTIERHLVAAQP